MLVLGAAAFTYTSYLGKAGEGPHRRVPVVEIAAVTVASAAWGLAVPSSPLLAWIDDPQTGTALVALIAFVGVVGTAVLSNLMKTPAAVAQPSAQGTKAKEVAPRPRNAADDEPLSETEDVT